MSKSICKVVCKRVKVVVILYEKCVKEVVRLYVKWVKVVVVVCEEDVGEVKVNEEKVKK